MKFAGTFGSRIFRNNPRSKNRNISTVHIIEEDSHFARLSSKHTHTAVNTRLHGNIKYSTPNDGNALHRFDQYEKRHTGKTSSIGANSIARFPSF
ncbi:hypothetical protein B9Z55_010476 [Caenorhabditis nigoni]|uniref:Uncharacterized protein n=1 Tax=Caenorhabditis nigoni TaxID=1611254 RepID=A0A2G5UFZ1_9PELO|nr:hypothetical protein B9Z55_010476 [Caenorhabditis nigoni]